MLIIFIVEATRFMQKEGKDPMTFECYSSYSVKDGHYNRCNCRFNNLASAK